MMPGSPTVPCPFCEAEIGELAKKCRHCGEWVASRHRELWVPAEELDDFNEGLESEIEILSNFVGSEFVGSIDPKNHIPTLPPPSDKPAARWSVYRLDDNGNEFTIERGLDLERALHLVGDFEACGHKQTYWARVE